MKLYKKLLMHIASNLLPDWFKGYRTIVLGFAIFLNGLVERITDSSILDYTCEQFPSFSNVCVWFHAGTPLMLLGIIIQVLRGGTEKALVTPNQ